MTDLKKSFDVETVTDLYTLTSNLGQGGAGTVYGGTSSDGQPVAVKILSDLGREKRKRFVNESNFLRRNSHPNLVPVIDEGLFEKRPFYVMPRYSGSLRRVMGGLAPSEAMSMFGAILDGAEAAHLLGAVHRDLKPENILVDVRGVPAIADFGIASFTEEHLRTLVETRDDKRMANFQYAAPEQREVGRRVGPTADINALGQILNELFTGKMPHGTTYRTIGSVAPEYAFLDPLVDRMLSQDPAARPQSIQEVKTSVQLYQAEAASLQKLDRLGKTVIPEGAIDDPLAHRPPTIIGATWGENRLVLTFDQVISPGWIDGLRHMGSYQCVMNLGPDAWQFNGNTASGTVREISAQSAIDHFKVWMPSATAQYMARVSVQKERERIVRLQALAREREAEEMRMRVNSSLRF